MRGPGVGRGLLALVEPVVAHPTAVIIAPASHADIERATACGAEAFAADPLMHYFFGASPHGVRAATADFFSLLMRVRLALGMPALVAREGDEIVGLVMGYDTAPPEWPGDLTREWEAFEAGIPGVGDRFEAYEGIADAHRPGSPHHYLGVIGVDPRVQGRGVGRELLDAFCALSAADPRSHGVYLETGNPASLAFYLRNGFVLCGEGPLDSGRLWCVFRANGGTR